MRRPNRAMCFSSMALPLLFAFVLSFAVVFLPAQAAEGSNAEGAMLVFVFDKSCRISCEKVRPVLLELEETYKTRLKVVELDISPDVLKETQKRANELGLKSFLSNTEDWYPAVGIFDRKGKKIKEILGAQPKAKYVAAIEKALEQK